MTRHLWTGQVEGAGSFSEANRGVWGRSEPSVASIRRCTIPIAPRNRPAFPTVQIASDQSSPTERLPLLTFHMAQVLIHSSQ